MFKIGGIFIPVTNLKRSTIWYEENLGAIRVDEWQEEGVDHGVDYIFPNDTKGFALIKVDKPQATEFSVKGNQKNSYYNFVVDNIYTAYNHLKENDVELTKIRDYGVMKGFDFFDPDDNPFSIVSEEEDSLIRE